MLFHKKSKETKEIPIDEVQRMTKKGASDKDIIKALKAKGYSYESIESAMLRAVKDNVNEEPKMVQRMETESPAAPSSFDFPMEQQEFAEPQPVVEEGETADVMLEELIEGIVDDKWRKFDDQTNKVGENFDKIRAEIRQLETRLDQTKRDSPARELESKMTDVSEQLEDLEARIGGLEKAFKQFLPSLTRNIESLSQMIHEMKEKQNLHEEEI